MEEWLLCIGLPSYTPLFLRAGYDDLETCMGELDGAALELEVGVAKPGHRKKLLKELAVLRASHAGSASPASAAAPPRRARSTPGTLETAQRMPRAHRTLEAARRPVASLGSLKAAQEKTLMLGSGDGERSPDFTPPVSPSIAAASAAAAEGAAEGVELVVVSPSMADARKLPPCVEAAADGSGPVSHKASELARR